MTVQNSQKRYLHAYLQEVSVNTLIIHGAEDETVPVECSRELKKKFPKLTYIEIAGGDHRMSKHLGIVVEETKDGSTQPTEREKGCEKSLKQYVEELL